MGLRPVLTGRPAGGQLSAGGGGGRGAGGGRGYRMPLPAGLVGLIRHLTGVVALVLAGGFGW